MALKFRNGTLEQVVPTIDDLKTMKLNVPAATADKAGVVKVGEGLAMDADGVLSAVAQEYGTATQDADGLMSAADKAKLDGIDVSELATQQDVLDLVDAAPDALNTLNELAAALGNDADFAATVTNSLAGKVDREDGKGLSSNDYTDAEKAKLAGLESYELPVASADTLGGVKVGDGLSVADDGTLSASGGDGESRESLLGKLNAKVSYTAGNIQGSTVTLAPMTYDYYDIDLSSYAGDSLGISCDTFGLIGSVSVLTLRILDGGSHTVSWNTTSYNPVWTWADGEAPELGSIDIVTFYCDEAIWYGVHAFHQD